jgi:hypothetical protein
MPDGDHRRGDREGDADPECAGNRCVDGYIGSNRPAMDRRLTGGGSDGSVGMPRSISDGFGVGPRHPYGADDQVVLEEEGSSGDGRNHSLSRGPAQSHSTNHRSVTRRDDQGSRSARGHRPAHQQVIDLAGARFKGWNRSQQRRNQDGFGGGGDRGGDRRKRLGEYVTKILASQITPPSIYEDR